MYDRARPAPGPEDPPIDIPCPDCGALCCRRFAIPVTPGDAARLAAHLGAAAAEVVRAETRDLSPEAPVVYLGGIPSQLALRTAGDDGRCAFLDEAAERCAVHDARPYVCRMYPFVVADDAAGAVVERTDAACPARFPLDDDGRAGLLAARRRWLAELGSYRRQAQAWNLAGLSGGVAALLAFCGDGGDD